MRANRRGVRGRDGAVLNQHGVVSRDVRVMNESSRGGRTVAAPQQRRQTICMKSTAAFLGQRIFDGASSEVVAKRERSVVALHHADGPALFDDRGRRGEQLVDEPALDARGHHRGERHDVARAVGKAGRTRHDCVAYGHRNLVAIGREHFGHEEWIAAGDIIQTVRRPAGFAGQHVDSLRRQGGQSPGVAALVAGR